ncbi:MAG: Sulfur carrier protein TusA [Thermodesulfobacteria bacterium]|nr:sulfurtransferase-like selenium metabolism protein YedF [Thermodesulfobacteriota bacterium]MCU4138576.1 Sulfur carrier protein TusA [Thermodesulfobacteriota bacterium]
MREVNAKGLPCPQPVIKTKEALESVKKGEKIKVILDNEASFRNVQKFVNAQKHKIVSTEKNGNEYIIVIEKVGEISKDVPISCEIPTEQKQDTFVIIATDTMGKEEKLGKILMKAYFETMLVHNLLPDRIFFMNTGIKLTTIEKDFIPLIKELEKKGVEIYTCGTCLKYFQLEDQLKVGKRAGTDVYLEGIFYFKKIVWIG